MPVAMSMVESLGVALRADPEKVEAVKAVAEPRQRAATVNFILEVSTYWIAQKYERTEWFSYRT